MLFLYVLDSGLCIQHSRFCMSEIGHNDGSALFNVFLLLSEGGLNLNRCEFLLLCLLLVGHHALEFFISFSILGLELGTFDCETFPQLLHLSDCVFELIKTN